ncbi:hypothetical protein OIU84_003687 [Salix udensis]|uniref:NTF2 domain-containing protein n=1 Tax=Salix udensis TaxID=889485 RepID=A0AAD6K2Q7_9ROSI|nr:hypothetical protein OIU84_003687 [Salix udensis]
MDPDTVAKAFVEHYYNLFDMNRVGLCKHHITTVDCQPSGPAGGMLVFVSGNLQLSGEQHALKFSQVFLKSSILSSMTMWH